MEGVNLFLISLPDLRVKISIPYPKMRSYTLFYSTVVVLIMTVYLVGMCQSRCTGFNSNPQ